MNVPKILENLNDFHQNNYERNELIHFTEDLKTLISESTKNLHYVGPEVNPTNQMINRVNNLLPKPPNFQKLNLFTLFAKHANSKRLRINLPTTLVRIEHMPKLYLIKSNNEGVHSIESSAEEFFSLVFAGKVDYSMPTFCIKISGEVMCLLSKEIAIKKWNSSDDPALIQYFIQSKANPATITRILWRKGAKLKYFTITNKKRVGKKQLVKSATMSGANFVFKRKPNLNAHEGRHATVVSPQAISYSQLKQNLKSKKNKRLTVVPYESHEMPKHSLDCDDIKIQKTMSNEFIFEENPHSPMIDDHSDNSMDNYLVVTKDIDSCYAAESFQKIGEIELMVEHIIEFLNTFLFDQYGGLKGIVLDFVKDKNNNWFLLECKEHLVDYSIHTKPKMKMDLPKNHDHLERAKTDISDINEESRPVSTTSMNPISEKIEEEVLSCPFKIRTKAPKIPHETTSEQDIIERLNKVNMKIDRLNAKKSPRRISPINREESIHEYLESFNHTKAPLTPTIVGHFTKLDQSPEEKRIEDGIERKCLEGVIGTYDEMTMNIKIAKVREQDIVIKYGGEQFWGKFIISLYNKILSCDLLNKYFKKSTIESFEGIVNGMFKIINGSLNLELRRRLRAAHYLRGITLEEFYCYSDIFDVTLSEFGVDDNDKQGIMSQIRSMKTLICKQEIENSK